MQAEPSDATLARAIAEEAGQLLLAIRARGGDGAALGAQGDREADDLIHARLRAARPNDFILSEETHDDRRRCAERRVWIVDPLDGTREYSDGREDWAVHIGLAIDNYPAVGAVALPAQGKLFATDRADPLPPASSSVPRLIVSRSRCPAIAERVGLALGAELIRMGSAGAKAMAVVDGHADIYLHDGGQYEWDSCAPVAVALAAGLHASRIDGSVMRYNCDDPLMPDLLICRPEWADRVLSLVKQLR